MGGGGGRGSGYLQKETVVLFLKGSRDVVVVSTALASHQCDPGLDSRTRRYHVGRVCC